jgi:tryptophan synthase alpha chain
MTTIAQAFSKAHSEHRAALIGYLPAGYPSIAGAVECIAAMVEGGVDIIEIGLPYSDPLMDGITIQEAVQQSLENGTKIADVIATAAQVSDLGVATLIMSYWNPIERYGVERFASELNEAGGVGVITPDLTPEESHAWVEATDSNGIDRVFLVALSSTDERLATVAAATTGFVYAGAVMGVTGARSSLGDAVREVVTRTREYTELPIAVGLGISTPEQAHEVAQFADGVIVGSAFINAIKAGGPDAARELAQKLRAGVVR